MLYEIEVIYKHTIVDIEADTEDEAIEKAAEMAWQLDADETSTKVLRCWDPNTPISYKAGDHFVGPGGEFIVTAVLPKVVFYEEVDSDTIESTMTDKEQFESAIRCGIIHSQREETLLEKAKRLIDNYTCLEFQARADFSDLSQVPIGHTTTEDDELPIQVYADLNAYTITRYISQVLVETRHYESLEEMIDFELGTLDFDDLIWFTDEQIAQAKASMALLPQPVEMSMDTCGLTVPSLPGTWHVTDHTDINGHTFWLMEHDTAATMPPIIVDNQGQCCIKNAIDGFSAENTRLLEHEILAVPQMPDQNITVPEMKLYGYYYGGMLPLLEEAATSVFNADCPVYCLYDDDSEGMVEDIAQIAKHAAHGGIFGVEKSSWLKHLEKIAS